MDPMDETPPTRAVDLLSRVAAALTNQEITNLLDLYFRRMAAAEGEIVALLAEARRRRSPPAPPTQAT
jgi:hypothetical protein